MPKIPYIFFSPKRGTVMRTTIGSFRHIKSVPFQVCDRKIVSEGEYEEKANKTKQKSLPRAPDKTPDVQYTGLDL